MSQASPHHGGHSSLISPLLPLPDDQWKSLRKWDMSPEVSGEKNWGESNFAGSRWRPRHLLTDIVGELKVLQFHHSMPSILKRK